MAKNKNIESVNDTVKDEYLVKQIATLSLSGYSSVEIGKQLGFTPTAVKRVQDTDRFKELIKIAADDELAPALAKAKSGLAKLSVKAVKVIEKAMDDALSGKGNMREGLAAAQTALKSVGLHEEGEKQADTSITVIMPNLDGHRTIEVTNETE